MLVWKWLDGELMRKSDIVLNKIWGCLRTKRNKNNSGKKTPCTFVDTELRSYKEWEWNESCQWSSHPHNSRNCYALYVTIKHSSDKWAKDLCCTLLKPATADPEALPHKLGKDYALILGLWHWTWSLTSFDSSGCVQQRYLHSSK